VSKRLRWVVYGVAACAVAVFVATLLMSKPEDPVGVKLVVPLEQGGELEVPKPPASSVFVLPQAEPPSTSTSTPAPGSPASPRPPTTPPPPTTPASTRPPLRSAGVDFQAENARITNGTVQSDHAGFTGSGFVDYENVSGSAVEWTVTSLETTGADVVIRYSNGSNESRPMTITVNGITVASASFGQTDGWSDWRTVTVRVNLLAGTSRIKATAVSEKGGPNVDKMTVV
jgi:hypothetical protein